MTRPLAPVPAPLDAEEGCEKYFPPFFPRNPLKRLDSDERIQGNPRKSNTSEVRFWRQKRDKPRKSKPMPAIIANKNSIISFGQIKPMEATGLPARRSTPSASLRSKRPPRRRRVRAGSGAGRPRPPAGSVGRRSPSSPPRSHRGPASPGAPEPPALPLHGRRAAARIAAQARSNGRRRFSTAQPTESLLPGSRLRAGAMSEWARTRSGAIAQREQMSPASAIVASIWGNGKGGEPPSWPGLTISIPIEAEFRSVRLSTNPGPRARRGLAPRPIGRSSRLPKPNNARTLRRQDRSAPSMRLRPSACPYNAG